MKPYTEEELAKLAEAKVGYPGQLVKGSDLLSPQEVCIRLCATVLELRRELEALRRELGSYQRFDPKRL